MDMQDPSRGSGTLVATRPGLDPDLAVLVADLRSTAVKACIVADRFAQQVAALEQRIEAAR